MQKKSVLVLCSKPSYRKKLQHLEDEYDIHYLDIDYHARSNTLNLDVNAYLRRACNYIRKHRIKGLYYFSDIGSLVASVLCKEFKFPGPSVESAFVSFHKYYTRVATNSSIRSTPVAAGDVWSTTYPYFVKAPCSTAGVLGFTIRNKRQEKKAHAVVKQELPKMNAPLKPLIKKHVDLKKFPLAVQDVVLIEEYVPADQVTVEGLVQNGKVNVVGVVDRNHAKGSMRLVDYYNFPSRLSKSMTAKLATRAKRDVKNVNLNNTAFNIDYWVKDGKIKLIEVNARTATLFHWLFKETLGYDSYRSGIQVALGEKPKIPHKVREIGALFNVNTPSEGKSERIFNYSIEPPVSMRLLIKKGTRIRQLSEFGQVLARFELYGQDLNNIRRRANTVRRKVLKKKI